MNKKLGKKSKKENSKRAKRLINHNKSQKRIHSIPALKVNHRKQDVQDIILDKLDVIKTIEGPVNSIILKPNQILNKKLGRNGPIIMLLGDYHNDVGKANRCETDCIISDGCYSLYKNSSLITYLDTIAKNSNITVDLFVEIWLHDDYKKELSKAEEEEYNVFLDYDEKKEHNEDNIITSTALNDVHVTTRHCISKGPLCLYKNRRIHMTDIRDAANDNKYNGDSLFEELKKLKPDHYEDDEKITLENLMNWKADLERKFKGFTAYELLLRMKDMFTNNYDMISVLKDPFMKSNSRMHHEIRQLPIEVLQELIKQAIHLYGYDYRKQKDVLAMFKDEVEAEWFFTDKALVFDDLINDRSVHIRSIDDISYMFEYIPITCGLMDLYTISRCLKTFKGGNPSQLSVIYQGSRHIKNIKILLDNMYDNVNEYGMYDFTKYVEYKNNPELLSKCIHKIY